MREKAQKLVDFGVLNAKDVLENVLFNYMNCDAANDFAETEYGDQLDGYFYGNV